MPDSVISSPMDTEITVNNKKVLNFCSNNYLGLTNHPRVIKAAQDTMKSRGFGMASVRLVCGTQDIHKELERRLAQFHQMEDCILYPSGFDSNGGFFEACLTKEDAIISDEKNHASIIDGIRLCKAKRYPFKHLNMADLERILQETQHCRLRVIVSDGVFSMDGDIAPLD